MAKRRVSYNIDEEVLEKLSNISRKELPNKSKLVEELLEKWIENRNNRMEKKLSKM